MGFDTHDGIRLDGEGACLERSFAGLTDHMSWRLRAIIEHIGDAFET